MSHKRLRVFHQTMDNNEFVTFFFVGGGGGGFKSYFKRKEKTHYVSMLIIGYLWEEYEIF